jgi:DivIVA domain-containing protein
MALTLDDLHNKAFKVVRLREGYDMDEVDDFLDEIEVLVTELKKDNDDLRSVSRGEIPASFTQELEASQADNAGLKSRIEELESTLAAVNSHNEELVRAASDGNENLVEELQRSLASVQSELAAAIATRDELTEQVAKLTHELKEAALAPAAHEGGVADTSVAAVRLLELAQRTADETVAEARVAAEAMRSDAHNESNSMVNEAKTQAANITRELETQRVGMERRIEELVIYEREYRGRLRSYLEGQLRELENKNFNANERQVQE